MNDTTLIAKNGFISNETKEQLIADGAIYNKEGDLDVYLFFLDDADYINSFYSLGIDCNTTDAVLVELDDESYMGAQIVVAGNTSLVEINRTICICISSTSKQVWRTTKELIM